MKQTPNPQVRELTPAEWPLCLPLGAQFHAEAKVAGRFDGDRFLATWTSLSQVTPVVILGLWQGKALVGGFGGMLIADLFDGRPCAQEVFWYVDPAARGFSGGAQLLQTFESWARAQGATEIRLIHLAGAGADRLALWYQRRGYRPVEISYRKPLSQEGG